MRPFGSVVGAALVTMLVLVLGVSAGMAAAQVPPTLPLPTTTSTTSPPTQTLTFGRSPDHGLPGAVIKVWGTCSVDSVYQGGDSALVTKWSDFEYRGEPARGPRHYTSAAYTIRQDGSWGGDFTIRTNAPQGRYTMFGMCPGAQGGYPTYKTLPFTVTEAARPTTTTTQVVTPSSTTTTVKTKAVAKKRAPVATTATTTTTLAVVVSTGGPVPDGGRTELVAAPISTSSRGHPLSAVDLAAAIAAVLAALGLCVVVGWAAIRPKSSP